jgi:hypothetical protein
MMPATADSAAKVSQPERQPCSRISRPSRGTATAATSGGPVISKDRAMPRAASKRSTITRAKTKVVVSTPNMCWTR